MTRDYAKSTTKKRQRKKPTPKTVVPGWIWLLTGAFLGAFIMFLVNLSSLPNNSIESKEKTAKAPDEAPRSPPKPILDFYERFKNEEVPIQENSNKYLSINEDEKDYYFMLQVASFNSPKDAEAARVSLLLLNLDASIEKFTDKKGVTWHRVVTGPYNTRSKVAKARNTLDENNFESIRLKRPKPKHPNENQ